MTRSKFAIALYLLLVFLSGAVVGVLGHRLYTATSVIATRPTSRTPDEYRQKYLAEMRTRLKLDDSQVQQLNAILDNTRDQFRDFRERHKTELKSIQDDQVAKINALLTEAQRSQYERMRAERERHSRRDGH